MDPKTWQPDLIELDGYCRRFADTMRKLDPTKLPETKVLCGIFTDGLQPKIIRDNIKRISPKTVKECALRARKQCQDFITAEATHTSYNRNFHVKNGQQVGQKFPVQHNHTHASNRSEFVNRRSRSRSNS
jgi:hypothetical protein